ncbi:serine protease snake [Tribolium castaneum]|uniref:Serine protease P58 n=1 Tax=Tribolium castaneum TaxID=7070 RepID=D6WCU1_TRICA|nr:PREDICTED: serine protease snake [Tribolium castaneum]EEZ99357.2 serine protease P58 [Tribolium castaneum]|eukprot:XP_973839.1 PREDICTED: serine protease snake [Tribolium castaneum]
MVYLHIILLFFALEIVYGQLNGAPCTVTSSGLSGICKLLSECRQVQDDIIKNQRLPQLCGFRETQSIVCCPPTIEKRKPGDISKIKCREYSSYASNECGHKIVKRIVGGTSAGRKEFPHMVLLGYEEPPDENIRWLCGGTIISDRFILTSANCFASRRGLTLKYVKMGVTDVNDTEHKQELKPLQIIVHPDFKPPARYNDIALVKLEKPIELNAYARPACLYTEKSISVEKGLATGWGYTSFASGTASDQLLKVALVLVSHEFCNMTYKNIISRNLKRGIVDDIQLCAGSGQDGKDTCQGDSGGPLQIYHEGDDVVCMYDIVGVTSFGRGCGQSPGVYTRVSHYIQWIEEIVWPEKHPQ